MLRNETNFKTNRLRHKLNNVLKWSHKVKQNIYLNIHSIGEDIALILFWKAIENQWKGLKNKKMLEIHLECGQGISPFYFSSHNLKKPCCSLFCTVELRAYASWYWLM